MTKRRSRRTAGRKPDPAKAVPKIDALRASAKQVGVPLYLPTEERAELGDLTVEAIQSHVYDRDRTGERARGRRVVMGYTLKEKCADAKARLKRFNALDDGQIAAGVTFDADIAAAGIEPKLVANLLGAGGGRSDGPANARIDAADRVHYALEVLRLCGEETVRVVLAVVVMGETSTKAGAPRYADAEKGRVHVAALLGAGLTMLAKHYELRAKHGPEKAARARKKARQVVKERVA